MLSLKNVCCGYGKDDVLKGISFDIKKGRCLSIAGPNGCGKTTLLRAAAGLIPYKGSIALKGNELGSLKRRDISSSIALMTQQSNIYFEYSVYETVAMGRYLHRRNKIFSDLKSDDKTVLHCLEVLGLDDIKDKSISTLSGGQLQRVLLARTFVQEPEIILLDEPTNHLDIRYQLELIEHLKKWVNEGEHAVIGVFHDLNLAMELSDTALLIHEGNQIAIGSAKDIFLSQDISDVYKFDVRGHMQKSLKNWQ